MITRFIKMFGFSESSETVAEDPVTELRLAAACVLAEAALIDGHVDESETTQIIAVLEKNFGLESNDARDLLERAHAIATNAVDWNRFTRVLKSEYDHAERVLMMEMLWQVVLADGELHAWEDSLVRRIAGLLHVDDRDRAMARRRAQKILTSQ